ncbi:protein kinase [Nonomuraea sp. NPDC050536]|uniref:serine/threonine-protein kinase n=1 Tax=Nonomuraea sp. NPDC050536 TaxID=3364366 RepID=UPI0037C969C3
MLGAGTTLNGRYALTDRLGGGGMGEVWRAQDTVLTRTVAVKVMNAALTENATFARRFQNEARAMATLSHPGVVDVYDYGVCEVEGRRVTFLVMAYVEGESLHEVLRWGPMTPEATMRLVAAVADALSAAHARGIVHRDVKPGNLLIKDDGSPVLVDFGIAHSASAQLTATGAMLCSAAYCAPEMATASEVTPSVDVYALGVVAYECLTGRLPFEGETPVQIIYKHLHAPVPPLPDAIPEGPCHVVTRAMEKSPERRWSSAARLAEVARHAATHPAQPSAVLTSGPTGPAGPALPAGTAGQGESERPGRGRAPRTGQGGSWTTGAGRGSDEAEGWTTGPSQGARGGVGAWTPGQSAGDGWHAEIGESTGDAGRTAAGEDAGPGAARTAAAGEGGHGRAATGGARTMEAGDDPRSSTGRRALVASLAMAAAVVVTAAVTASSLWMRPAPADEETRVYSPEISATTAPTQAVPQNKKHPAAPPPKESPKPHPSGSHSASATPTATATPTVKPTVTPTTHPTTPTAAPSSPGPEEPPDSEPPVTDPPGDVQCVRTPCHP